MTTERERFEEWCRTTNSMPCEHKWIGWQAALSAPPGYALVPVEPTPEMVKQGRQALGVYHTGTPRMIYAAMIYAAVIAAWTRRRAQPEPAAPADCGEYGHNPWGMTQDEVLIWAELGIKLSKKEAELRGSVRRMTNLLANNEWAEHLSADEDVSALEQQITRMLPSAPSVAPEPPMQAGMSNAELREAWGRKLPGVAPSDRDLSAFSIGAEVGFKRAQDLERQDWDRVHHALKDAGVHPGRTADHLADVIAKALAAHPPRAPLTDEHVTAVVRSVCPNLAETSKAWRDLVVECRYWLEAAHGIGGK